MAENKVSEKQREHARKYQNKFYRPTVYFDKAMELKIKEYCEENKISVNEFLNLITDKFFSEI